MQAAEHSEPAAGPRGRGLLLARAVWVLVAVLSLALSISVPVRYAQLLPLSRLPAEVTADEAHASLWVRPPNAMGRTVLELTGQPPATTVRGRPAPPHPLARRAGE